MDKLENTLFKHFCSNEKISKIIHKFPNNKIRELLYEGLDEEENKYVPKLERVIFRKIIEGNYFNDDDDDDDDEEENNEESEDDNDTEKVKGSIKQTEEINIDMSLLYEDEQTLDNYLRDDMFNFIPVNNFPQGNNNDNDLPYYEEVCVLVPKDFFVIAEEYEQIYRYYNKFIQKPANAYIIYTIDNRKKIVSENSGLDFAGVARKIAESYRKLSPIEHNKYKLLAEKNKEEYDKKLYGLNECNFDLLKYKYYTKMPSAIPNEQGALINVQNTFVNEYKNKIKDVCDDYLCDDLISIVISYL